MPSDHHNAFGDPIVPPEKLSRQERVQLLRRAAQSLNRGRIDGYTAKWLSAVFDDCLASGADVDAALGIRPPRGSTLTPARLTASERHNRLLAQLAAAVGTRQAARVLAGTATVPAGAAHIVAELADSPGPRSLAAISRARSRVLSSAR